MLPTLLISPDKRYQRYDVAIVKYGTKKSRPHNTQSVTQRDIAWTMDRLLKSKLGVRFDSLPIQIQNAVYDATLNNAANRQHLAHFIGQEK